MLFLMKTKNVIVNIVLIFLLFASRLLLLSSSQDFFDANEYSNRVRDTSLLSAVSSGHPPFHPLFIGVGNIFYKFMQFFKISDPNLATTLPSAIFGCLAVIIFYFLIKKIFNRNIALIASIIISIIPFFWISSITILVDNIGIFFILLSAYLYYIALEKIQDKSKVILILLAGISFGLALFAHTSFAMWLPIFLGIFVFWQLKKGFKFKDALYSLTFLVGPVLICLAYAYLLVYSGFNSDKLSALNYLLLGNIGDKKPLDFLGTIRSLWLESGSIIIILTLIGLIKIIWDKKKESILLIFWILPAFIVSSYVYENLHGRALILALFSMAILVAYLIDSIKNSYLRYSVLLISLLLTLMISLPIIFKYHNQIAPNETLLYFEKNIEHDSLFIGTNTLRTWNDNNLVGKYERLGDVDTGTSSVLDDIEQYQKDHKSIYLSSDAVFYPNWRYDGKFFDIRSLGVNNKTSMNIPLSSEFFENNQYDLFSLYPQFKKYLLKNTKETDISKRIQTNLDNIQADQGVIIGRIVDNSGGKLARGIISAYDKENYIVNENILRDDILFHLYRIIIDKRDPIIWGITDRMGVFVLPTNDPVRDVTLSISTDPYNSRLKDSSQFFLGRQTINTNNIQVTVKDGLSKQEIVDELNKITDNVSFYINKNKNASSYTFTIFSCTLSSSNRIEAEDLAHYTGKIINVADASNKQVMLAKMGKDTGFLTAGPYLTLPAGKYELAAKIKLDNANMDENDFGTINIGTDYGKTSLGEKKFTQDDLTNFQSYNITKIEFDLQNTIDAIEFRAYASGHANLYIDYFELRKK